MYTMIETGRWFPEHVVSSENRVAKTFHG